MCDSMKSGGHTGWRGWMALPDQGPQGVGPWLDLTWPLSPNVPRISVFPPPRIELIHAMPADRLNVTQISLIVHTGTHVDSPRHFFMDGPAFQDVPLERLMGPGVVWHIDKPLYGTIEPDDLERMRPQIEPGDIVAIETGCATRVGTQDYDRHSSLSEAAAQWLVDHRVKLLAVDTPTPDIAIDRRPPDFDWPVHHILLRDGVLVSEQVANLAPLAGRRVEFMFCPLNIENGDGAPARVLARPLAS